MQWTAGQNAGFSTAKPWLPVNPACQNVNVESEQNEPDSFLALYRRLLTLRSRYEILRTGEYEPLSDTDNDIFAYARWIGREQHVFVALNFGDTKHRVTLPHTGSVLCATHPTDYPEVTDDGSVELRPYEGVLIGCSEHRLSIE